MALTKVTGTGLGLVSTATIKTATNEEDALLIEQSDGTDVGALRINNGRFVLSGRNSSTPVQIQTHDGNEDIEVDPDGFIKFETAGSERMRILAGGGLTFNGDTATANALDDYEEGSFTPTFGGSSGNQTVSYSTQLGTYVKVGKLVYVNVSVIASGTPSGGSGDLIIASLPFSSKSGVQQAGSVAFANNMTFGNSGTHGQCNIEGNVNYLNINSQEYDGTSAMHRVAASGIHNSGPRIVCSICYETA